MSAAPLLSPRRPRLARALAALVQGGSAERDADYGLALANGFVYWSVARPRGRPPYWECWCAGDAGTMADQSLRHETAEAAWRDLLDEAVLPPAWAQSDRSFLHAWRCLGCGRCDANGEELLRAGMLWNEPACRACRADEREVVRVAPAPLSVQDCAVFASDPEGIEEAERLARKLEGQPSARVAWRVAQPESVLRPLRALGALERQADLLALGYAIDPISIWEAGIVLVAPWLAE